MNNQYTIKDVLKIVRKQLDTIPVSGQHVQTMAAVYGNLDAVIAVLETPDPKPAQEEMVDNGSDA